MLQSLKAVFKNAVLEPVATAATYLLWPLIGGGRRFLIGLAAASAVSPLTGMAFPSAQEYLRSKGLDPEIAEELSDFNVRIRERDLLGNLHFHLSLPSLAGRVISGSVLDNPVQAAAASGFNKILYGFNNQVGRNYPCMVSLMDSGSTFTDYIELAGGIPAPLIEKTGISDAEFHTYVTLHEIRHCSSTNIKQAIPFIEADADWQALQKTAEIYGNEDLIRTVMLIRAMGNPHSHDTALYLDAVMRGEDVPNRDDVVSAGRQAFDMMARYKVSNSETPDFVSKTQAFRKVLESHRNEISPLAVRRAELYIEAAEYFAPSSVKSPATASVPVLDVG